MKKQIPLFFLIILFVLTSCETRKEVIQEHVKDTVVIDTLEMHISKQYDISFTDTVMNIYRDSSILYQIHLFRNQNYKFVFHNLAFYYDGKINYIKNYFEVFLNDTLKFRKFSDLTENDTSKFLKRN